jgi:hypothetical protein
MNKLFPILFLLAASVLAGSFVVAALTLDLFDAASVSLAALAGAVVALPVAWVLAARMSKTIRPS